MVKNLNELNNFHVFLLQMNFLMLLPIKQFIKKKKNGMKDM